MATFAERHGYTDIDELHRSLWGDWERERAESAAAYDADPDDLYAAWWYLHHHPIFTSSEHGFPETTFPRDVWFHVTKVHPISRRVEGGARDTETEVWVEAGPWETGEELAAACGDEAFASQYPDGVPTHDPALDGGGGSIDDAIVKLAARVAARYGHTSRAPLQR